MESYSRKNALFSLCGLNCCLCPRFNTDGSSKCPGCGGKDFSAQHPTCAVITCNKKNDNVEYCFECSQYSCKKYKEESKTDSFISYKNVKNNFIEAKNDIKKYINDLEKKHEYLADLIENYNDGRTKGFYCLAIDLFPVSELADIMKKIKMADKEKSSDIKEKVKKIKELFNARAGELKIEITLRKN